MRQRREVKGRQMTSNASRLITAWCNSNLLKEQLNLYDSLTWQFLLLNAILTSYFVVVGYIRYYEIADNVVWHPDHAMLHPYLIRCQTGTASFSLYSIPTLSASNNSLDVPSPLYASPPVLPNVLFATFTYDSIVQSA